MYFQTESGGLTTICITSQPRVFRQGWSMNNSVAGLLGIKPPVMLADM
jgi:hypothetical protein